MTNRYGFQVSEAALDADWDRFLARTPGGHHVQTSLWAQVKATLGMRAVRVLATEEGKLVGGGQILISKVPILGAVGYVSRGPLVATDDPLLRAGLLNRMSDAARDQGVRHLTVQPPTNGFDLVAPLLDEGYRPTSQTVAPPASVLVDLTLPLDEMMARMHKKTRYNIRLGERRGITVRTGGESDLHLYCQMLESTARRQGFRPYPHEYYTTMWRVLEPHGYLRLSVVEQEGEAIAAQFTVPFGDTVINKLGVWSGKQGESHPNEVLHWDTLQWSKDHGYRLYDFEGIDLRAAKALLGGESVPPNIGRSVTSFKLGFGGEIRLFPGAYFDASSSIVRWLYGSAFPRMSEWEAVRKGVAMLRTRGRPGSGGAKPGYSR